MPDLPDVGDYGRQITEWWLDMGSRRSQGINGPNPIDDQSLIAWAALGGTILNRNEVRLIFAIDDAYLSAIAVSQSKKQEGEK